VSDSAAVDAFVEALSRPSEEVFAALPAHLADDVIYVAPGGPPTQGRDEVVDKIRTDRLRSFYGGATWSDGDSDGESINVRAMFQSGAPVAGAALTFDVDGDRINRVTVTGIQIQQPVSEVDLSGDLKTLIDTAWSVNAIAVVYVDEAGQPHIAPRGSTHVFSTNQIAIWIYSQGMPRGLAANPAVALWYSDNSGEVVHRLGIEGRARIELDEELRNRVYEGAPPHEQARDAERRGAAVIIDVETVAGRTPFGAVNMKRGG